MRECGCDSGRAFSMQAWVEEAGSDFLGEHGQEEKAAAEPAEEGHEFGAAGRFDFSPLREEERAESGGREEGREAHEMERPGLLVPAGPRDEDVVDEQLVEPEGGRAEDAEPQGGIANRTAGWLFVSAHGSDGAGQARGKVD